MTSKWGYRATVTRVIDGDTACFDADLGFYLHHALTGRLRYLDTPEGRHTVAAEFVRNYLPIGSEVWIETTKADKYGRWLVEVWRVVDGVREATSLNDILLVNGLAVPYNP